ncbi:unnamed protein product [Closterium sp. Naga37s-1]|nr:unnamed protein product [Closterium sp. Naga37s-1]
MYLNERLKLSQATATEMVHLFIVAAYLAPLFGAFISDSYLGKYRTILYLSFIYCAGNWLVAFSALHTTPSAALPWALAGLSFLALGSGGIKPCVSSFGGDQIEMTNPPGAARDRLVRQFFSYFYFAINVGSGISTIVTPLLRVNLSYSAAFALPAVLMMVATCLFWLGSGSYVHQPPAGNVVSEVLSIIISALWPGKARRKSYPTLAMPMPVPIPERHASCADVDSSPLLSSSPASFGAGNGGGGGSSHGGGNRFQPGSPLQGQLSESPQSQQRKGSQPTLQKKLSKRGSKRAIVPLGYVPKAHWLDPAKGAHGDEAVEDVKLLLRVLALFAPVPIFWSLFDQQASRWVFQAERMDGRIWGVTVEPDQMQVGDGDVGFGGVGMGGDGGNWGGFVQQASRWVFQAERMDGRIWGVTVEPDQMQVGCGDTGALWAGGREKGGVGGAEGLDWDGDLGCFDQLARRGCSGWGNGWQDLGFKVELDQMQVRGGEGFGGFGMGGNEGRGNRGGRIAGQQMGCYTGRGWIMDGRIFGVRVKLGQMQVRCAFHLLFPSPLLRPPSLPCFLHAQTMNAALILVMIPLFDQVIYPACERLGVSIRPIRRMATGMTLGALSFALSGLLQIWIEARAKSGSPSLLLGSAVTAAAAGVGSVGAGDGAGRVPQYVIMTAGEILFSITGLELAYSQAPASMTAVVTAFWCLTVAGGNLFTAVVVGTVGSHLSQTQEFFFFTIMCLLSTALLLYVGKGFIYVESCQDFEQPDPFSQGGGGGFGAVGGSGEGHSAPLPVPGGSGVRHDALFDIEGAGSVNSPPASYTDTPT